MHVTYFEKLLQSSELVGLFEQSLLITVRGRPVNLGEGNGVVLARSHLLTSVVLYPNRGLQVWAKRGFY